MPQPREPAKALPSRERRNSGQTKYYRFDYSGFKTKAILLLPAAANHILGLGNDKEINGKKRFLDAMAAANVAYSLCSTLDGAKELHLELAFFSAIAAVLRKREGVDKKRSAEQKHSALKQILDNAVKAEDVQDIFQLAGLERPNIGLLSDEFLEDVRRMERKNLAVELLERLLQGKIKAQTRTNLVQEKKYSDRLIEALRKYQTCHSFRAGSATRILRVCWGKMWQHCARITFILVRSPQFIPMANLYRFLPALLLLLLMPCTSLRAESPSSGELTTAAMVRSLSDADAARGKPVRLRGIVTEVHDKIGVFLFDNSESIYVRATESTGTLAQADLVEIVGTTAAGLYAPCIENAAIRLIGKGELPPPREVSFADLASGHCDAQWVEVRGVIHTVTYTQWHQPRFLLVMDGGRMEVRAEKPVKTNLDALIDAEVRCRGVIGGRFSKFRQLVAPEMQIQTEAQIEVVQPASAAAFAVRPRTVAQLMQFDPRRTFQHRVKLAGTILHSEPGESVFLRDLSGPIRIDTRDTLPLLAGDRIEALGFPAMSHHGPFLEDAIIRKTGSEPPPVPINASVPDLLRSGKDGDLIRLDAEMLWMARQADEQLLTLRAGDTTFMASLRSEGHASTLPDLGSGSLLRLTGICQFQGQRIDRVTNAMVLPEAFSLRLRSPGDLVLLRRPPWWTTERLLRIVALLITCAAAAMLWAWQLKQRVRVQGTVLSKQVRREAVLEERHRVAMEIHDTLAQGFTAIWVQLSVIKEKLFDSPANALPHLEMAQHLVRKSLGDARRSIRDLNDCTLIDQDPARALAAIGEELTKGAAVRVRVDTSGDAASFPASVGSQLLRIGQEAITNAIKHANARHVRVELKYGTHFVLLRVKDDGVGFDPSMLAHVTDGGGFGLIGMQERARQIGGELSIESAPGNGAEIVVVAPVMSQASARISADEEFTEVRSSR